VQATQARADHRRPLSPLPAGRSLVPPPSPEPAQARR
jgi:hypothetical protein